MIEIKVNYGCSFEALGIWDKYGVEIKATAPTIDEAFTLGSELMSKATKFVDEEHIKHRPYFKGKEIEKKDEESGIKYVPIEKQIPDIIVRQKYKNALLSKDEKLINELEEMYIFK